MFSAPKKTVKIVNDNVTKAQSSAMQYVFVPVGSTGKLPEQFVADTSKRWMNLEKLLRVWQTNHRRCVKGALEVASVQTNAAVVFANCLDETGNLHEESFQKCIKAFLAEIKNTPGCVCLSGSIEPLVGNLENLAEVFTDKNISTFIFN